MKSIMVMAMSRVLGLVLCFIIRCNEICSTEQTDVIVTTYGLISGNQFQSQISDTSTDEHHMPKHRLVHMDLWFVQIKIQIDCNFCRY